MSAPEPEWIGVLRAYVKQHGLRATSKCVGYSTTTISLTVSGKYPGQTDRLQRAVEGALMGSTVECPVVGEIPRQDCIGHQRRAGSGKATNHIRIALAEACPICTNATKTKAGDTAGKEAA